MPKSGAGHRKGERRVCAEETGGGPRDGKHGFDQDLLKGLLGRTFIFSSVLKQIIKKEMEWGSDDRFPWINEVLCLTIDQYFAWDSGHCMGDFGRYHSDESPGRRSLVDHIVLWRHRLLPNVKHLSSFVTSVFAHEASLELGIRKIVWSCPMFCPGFSFCIFFLRFVWFPSSFWVDLDIREHVVNPPMKPHTKSNSNSTKPPRNTPQKNTTTLHSNQKVTIKNRALHGSKQNPHKNNRSSQTTSQEKPPGLSLQTDPRVAPRVLINALGSMAKAWNFEGERLLRASAAAARQGGRLRSSVAPVANHRWAQGKANKTC